jgi:hypothetical protein
LFTSFPTLNLFTIMLKLPFTFTEKWSKESRQSAKLDRIANRRLGTSPTEYRPRGSQNPPSNLQVESGLVPMSRRKSSLSLASTGSAMKKLGENFRKGIGEHKMHSLRADYKNLIKLLDNLDYPGWKRLANHLEKDVIKARLMETAE